MYFMKNYKSLLIIVLLCSLLQTITVKLGAQAQEHDEFALTVGAERMYMYLELLQDKKVAIVANPSSLVGHKHLVDTLLALKVDVVKIFSPEHGFRGKAGAGEEIASTIDPKTKLPVISLYGANKKPSEEMLRDIDILIFDLQDVGTRFYTYVSTMHLCMEACVQNRKKIIILDRPNPNGYYIDGPVLNKEFNSFVGMDVVPIVHGMTLGEYAKMLDGEGRLTDIATVDLTVVPMLNYDHSMQYNLPVPPSPNLPNHIAVNLYPSLCLFEGTTVSVGRGTASPFQVYGHPAFKENDTSFTPKAIQNQATSPLHKGKICKGYSLKYYNNYQAKEMAKLQLDWIINAYKQLGSKPEFFNPYFDKLAGTDQLRIQIMEGKTADEIREGWKEDIDKFKEIRRKYLLYPDFE